MSKVKKIPAIDGIEISMTDFVNFVLKTGTAKQTAVNHIKNRPPYKPGSDYYGAFRRKIRAILKTPNTSKHDLNDLLTTVQRDRIENYAEVIEGCKKFLGRKKVELVKLESRIWSFGKLSIKVNPEWCLQINDAPPTIIKLYFSKDVKLTAANAKVSLELLSQVYHKELAEGWSVAMLDVKRNKLVQITKPKDHLPLLKGEANSFETMWFALDN